MKRVLVISVLMVIGHSCTNPIKNEQNSNAKEIPNDTITYKSFPKEPEKVTLSFKIDSIQDLLGYWVGDFEPDYDLLPEDYGIDENEFWNPVNKINLSIDEIKDDSLFGHSVVAGNRRLFRGSIHFDGKNYHCAVYEEGDNQYDGAFQFQIAEQDSFIRGTWTAYGKIRTPFRRYQLQKTLFVYNPEWAIEGIYFDETKIKKNHKVWDGDEEYEVNAFLSAKEESLKINPSIKLLKKEDVENLSKGDLLIIRNSIYARHGYSFKKVTLRNYFDAQTWYIPVYTDIKRFLTEVEKQNIQLLLKYEKYAKEYYDVFGR